MTPGDDRITVRITGPAPGLSRARLRAALAELDRDIQDRLIVFDGGPQLLSWAQAHKHHADEPYIGCPFCRDRFVLKDDVVDITQQEAREAADWIRGHRPLKADELRVGRNLDRVVRELRRRGDRRDPS